MKWIGYFLTISLKVYALEAYYLPPSLEGFDSQKDYLNSPAAKYDSEVESDYLTFSPISCKHFVLMNKQDNAFCGNVGSISGKRFFIDNIFITKHKIHEKAYFRFHYKQEQNFSKDQHYHNIEFLFPINKKNHIGVHGQLDTNKAEDDAGLSYNYLGETLFSRLEFTAFDFSRNKRNEANDKFIDKPILISFSTLYKESNKSSFLQLMYEPEWHWLLENTDEIKSERYYLDFFFQKNSYYYSFEYLSKNTNYNADEKTEEIFDSHFQREENRWTQGFRWVKKEWEINKNSLKHYDLLPFVWYKMTTKWDIGYEVNWHRATGDLSLSSVSDKASKIEHRLNFAWKVLNKKDISFKFLFTFDADDLIDQPWEGGNGQFQMNF